MDDETYISVALDEYIELSNLRDFLAILVDNGVEEWEDFEECLDIFLEVNGEELSLP